MKKLEFESNGSKWLLVDIRAINFSTHKGYLVMCSTDLGVNNKCLKIDRGDTLGFYRIRNESKGVHLRMITEEKASEVVGDMKFNNFGNYLPTYKSKIEAILKSKSVYLYENPAPLLSSSRLEAESKTFYNPILFKILK